MGNHIQTSETTTSFIENEDGASVIELFIPEDATDINDADAAVLIFRCLDDSQSFLVAPLISFTYISGSNNNFSCKVNTHNHLTNFLNLPANALPVFDEYHIGPLNREDTKTLLKILHGIYKSFPEASEHYEAAKRFANSFLEQSIDLETSETGDNKVVPLFPAP